MGGITFEESHRGFISMTYLNVITVDDNLNLNIARELDITTC